MSKNALTVALKKTRMGWCVFLNGEPYALGTQLYCQEVSRDLILRHLRHGPACAPVRGFSKGGAA
jgi:hypothetical protein